MTRIDSTDANQPIIVIYRPIKGLYRPITARYIPLLTHQMDIYVPTH